MTDKPETEFRWVKQDRTETLYFFVEVVKGTPNEKIIEVLQEAGIPASCTPDESEIHSDELSVSTTLPTASEIESYRKKYIGYDLIEETT
jgi:flagellar biosynthesis/type III secretory pathway M-ring protein FliF/YscJ